jgi:hypothetical protein
MKKPSIIAATHTKTTTATKVKAGPRRRPTVEEIDGDNVAPHRGQNVASAGLDFEQRGQARVRMPESYRDERNAAAELPKLALPEPGRPLQVN